MEKYQAMHISVRLRGAQRMTGQLKHQSRYDRDVMVREYDMVWMEKILQEHLEQQADVIWFRDLQK